MKEFGLFLKAVFWRWQSWAGGSGFGGAVVVFMALWDRLVPQRAISNRTYLAITVIGFLFGAVFLAWRDEHARLEREKQKRDRPEVTAEFRAFGGVPRQWVLFIQNSSDSPAIHLHVADIRHNEKVLRFIPISAARKDIGYPVKCGILYNGWTQTDNVASLWEGETFIGMSPMFDLRIRFSNFDSLSAQKTWIVSAHFWWNVQQQVIEMSHQSIELVK